MSAVQGRGARYSTAMVEEARRLYGDGDAWSPYQIAELFKRRGTPVNRRTIARWVDPDAAHRQRAADAAAAAERRAERSDGRVVCLRPPTGAWKWKRAQSLRRAGAPVGAIATVMEFDFGDGVTADELRHAFDGNRPPRRWRERKAAA